jgi:hypothetical protein
MGKTQPYIAPMYEKKKRFWRRALGAHIWEFPYMGPIYEKKKGPDGSGDAGGLVFLLVFYFFFRLLNVVLMFLFHLKETAWAFIL